MKDAEPPASFFGKLSSVDLGWTDEDDQAITGAVFMLEDNPPTKKDKKDSKTDGFRKVWENAWWSAGAEVIDGQPYLSRSALKEKLTRDGNAERTVRNMVNPSYTDKLIGYLTQAEMIRATEHGWVMVNEVETVALLLRKNGA